MGLTWSLDQPVAKAHTVDVLDKPVVPDDLDDEECGNPVPCPSFFIKFVKQQKVGGWSG